MAQPESQPTVPATASPAGDSIGAWKPIETCPPNVRRALICWPAFELSDDLEQSDVRRPADDLVAEGYRMGGDFWECDMVTEHFEDEAGFGYGDATHWMPLPAPPRER